jgi:Flp pilus assembly protein TadD
MPPPRERTPLSGAIVPDPYQLTLGGLDAASAPPSREAAPAAPDDHEAGVIVREPPVCGEWSFDPDESPEARAAQLATPPVAHPVIPPPPPGRPSAAGVPAVGVSDATARGAGGVAASGARGAPTSGAGGAPIVAPPPAPRPAARALTPPTPLPALDELKSIHDAHPGDEQTALALSSALAKRGNIEGALGVLERAIEAGADVVTLRCARAAILSGRLRYDEAERELRKAQKSKPDDQNVLLQQGILACRRAKWREAVEPLARVVKLDPLSGQAHFYLGEAQNKLDRLGEALESYHRAAELDPDNWRAFKGVGIVLDRMGRSAEAAEYYRRARDGQRG